MFGKSRRKKYSWRYIDKACANIAEQYMANPPPNPAYLPEKAPRIIGISRGGLIPATLVAKYLKASEVYSLGLKSYSDDSAFADRRHTPDVYQNIAFSCPRLNRGDPILLIDDISDEGNTLEYIVKNILPDITSVVTTATLFIKDKTQFVPNIFHAKVPDNQWVIFPWEKM